MRAWRLRLPSAQVAERYPEIQLLICEGYTDSLIDWVTSGELDVAIINMPKRKIPLTAHYILDERMMFAHRAANSVPFPKNVAFKQLSGLDLIVPSRRHGLRMILDEAASEAGVALKPRLEVDTLSAICEIVATTDMVTVLPGVAQYPMLSSGFGITSRVLLRSGADLSLVPYRIPTERTVDAPGPCAREHEQQKDQAKQNRGVAAVKNGKEAAGGMCHEIGHRHFAREDKRYDPCF